MIGVLVAFLEVAFIRLFLLHVMRGGPQEVDVRVDVVLQRTGVDLGLARLEVGDLRVQHLAFRVTTESARHEHQHQQ